MTEVLATEPRTLQSLTERQRQELFDVLQQQLPAAWGAIRLNLGGESIVVVPSVSLDRVVDRRAPLQAYEERFLFLLLLLRQPRLQLIYVTSNEVDPTIVEYYLSLLPGVIPSHARARLSEEEKKEEEALFVSLKRRRASRRHDPG